MKMKLLTIGFLAAAALVSCTKMENFAKEGTPVKMSFRSRILGTKTTLYDGTKTKWLATDEITVFNGTSAATFSNDLGSGSALSANFSGTIESAATYYGMYPVPASNVFGFTNEEWAASRSWTATGPVYTVPVTQTAVTNNIAEGLDVLVAETTSSLMTFDHACAALQFTIGPSSPAITSIMVEGAKIAGNYRYVMSSGNQESVSGSSGAITLSMGGSTFPEGNYYIIIAVRNYPSGLTFTFTRSDGKKASAVKSGSLTPEKGHVYPMGTVGGLTFNTVLGSAPSVGDSCDGGIVAYVNDGSKYALVLNLNESSEYWSEGVAWASGLGEGWYLPSLDEMKNVRSGILSSFDPFDDFNDIITGTLSGTALQKTTYYWTSTEGTGGDSGKAQAYKFFNSGGTAADWSLYNKTGKQRPVRAVRKVFFE